MMPMPTPANTIPPARPSRAGGSAASSEGGPSTISIPPVLRVSARTVPKTARRDFNPQIARDAAVARIDPRISSGSATTRPSRRARIASTKYLIRFAAPRPAASPGVNQPVVKSLGSSGVSAERPRPTNGAASPASADVWIEGRGGSV
jgi:hypothetical protein